MEISQETLTELLKLGGQYAIPAAALLRALYNGYRGKMPEGFRDIAGASVASGLTSLTNNEQPNSNQILLDLLGNTVFVAGILSFIVLFFLRLPNLGLLFDAVVGGILGGAGWVVWFYVLNNPNPDYWLLAGAIAGGVVGFIVLRFTFRQIMRVMALASTLLAIGILLVVVAGGAYVLQQAGVIQLPAQ